MGLDSDDGRATLSQLLAQLAAALVPIARRTEATLLLLPTYTASYENDATVCAEFGRLAQGCDVRIASIEDPALYKAVTGRLTVMISSRMHPLILAAGAGTPIVGLAYNGKFEGMFDMLGVPRRMLWLDAAIEDLPARLGALIDEAVNAKSKDGLLDKAARLGDIVRSKTSDLLHAIAAPRAA